MARRARWLVRPRGWLWGARWAVLRVKWYTRRPVTIRHYFDFGDDRYLVGDDLCRPEAWDAIRANTEGPFALPDDRAEWEATAEEPSIRPRAIEIDRWLRSRGVGSVASYGVGRGLLELWLHRLSPDRCLIISEFGPDTVDRLGRVFPNVDVRRHDLLADAPLDAEVHLFSRIDTELTNGQWRSVFGRFSDRLVLFVAADVLGLPRALMQLRIRHAHPSPTRAGYLRNRPAFEALWRQTHRAERVRFGDVEGWALDPKR
jgi:hypothetical protein